MRDPTAARSFERVVHSCTIEIQEFEVLYASKILVGLKGTLRVLCQDVAKLSFIHAKKISHNFSTKGRQ
jgi:hypothetical protein